MPKSKIIISWSSGKDSALALYKLWQNQDYEVVGLLTTITKDYRRVSMHGVHEQLLELQANRLSLPLYKVKIPKACSDEVYRKKMAEIISKLENLNITHIVFGDILLEEIKQYREQQLKKTRICPLFPLWHQDSKQLAKDFIALSFKAIVTCLDPARLAPKFIGHEYNNDFLSKLPKNVDPCGENGEFHTFVYDAPFFKEPISIKKDAIVEYNGFLFNNIKVVSSNFD